MRGCQTCFLGLALRRNVHVWVCGLVSIGYRDRNDRRICCGDCYHYYSMNSGV